MLKNVTLNCNVTKPCRMMMMMMIIMITVCCDGPVFQQYFGYNSLLERTVIDVDDGGG